MDSEPQTLNYRWRDADGDCLLSLVHVAGCVGIPYSFGYGQPTGAGVRPVELRDFFIATVPVTQALWVHVMGANPSVRQGMDLPLENVSWDVIVRQGGFIERINKGAAHTAISRERPGGRFRLPTESEWEYAARGGHRWLDGFRFSGSNDIDSVAWYDRKHGDHTQPVGLKAPNQLGIHDMSGNVWEWCQDVYTPETGRIPLDGSAFVDRGSERVLRGGCFHNWAIHCTVSKRYQIAHEYHDGCIGFRLVFALGPNESMMSGTPLS